ncbi:MAG TPA: cupredoxin domain-containing protein [Acidimicrobiia bacterium]
MRARRGRWAAVLLAGASGVAALGPVLWFTAQPAAAFAQKVNIVNFAYSPASTPIKPGDKIIWVNNSNTKHTVTSDGGGTNFDYTVAPGREAELRFDTAGTYTYHCNFHSQMTGKIEVSDNPPPPPPPPTTTTTPPPPPPPPPTTAPPTTTTTAPATTTTDEPTTTTTAPRPAAGTVPLPPVPNTAAAPAPPLATSSTTTMPSTTTTTAALPTTATSVPPAPAGDPAPPPAPTPPPSAGKPGGDQPVAAAPPAAVGGKLDLEAIALVTALVAVGAFGGWTLIRVRPGRI